MVIKITTSTTTPEFNKFGEIKTYWINGKNIYVL